MAFSQMAQAFTPGEKDSADLGKVIKKVKPVFNFDSRYSFINHQQVRISGFKLGVEWAEKFRTGLGFYALSTPLDKELQAVNEPDNRRNGRFRFNYIAFYGEYVLLSQKKWEVSFPLQFGLGEMFYDFRDRHGFARERDSKPIALVEPSISAHYKIFFWLGVGGGAGYRYMLSNQDNIEHNFDSPIYYMKAKLFVGEVYRELKKRKQG